MDSEHILSNLAITLDKCNHQESQNLVKKIIDLAAKKLNSSKYSKPVMDLKGQQSINLIKRLLIKESRKLKRKFISKGKLRRIAIKRIASKNRRFHEQFVKATHQKQFKINQRTTKTSDLSISQVDKEEHKLQSAEQEYEVGSTSRHRLQNPKQSKETKTKKGAKKTESCKQAIDQKFKKIRKNFQNYLKSNTNQSNPDDITCPVCIQTLIDPVSTICGHSFCFRCLDQSLLFGSTCPVCRLFIKGSEIITCTYLKDLIKAKLPRFLDDQSTIQTYQQRKKQYDEWKKSRFINPIELKNGDTIDVRDTQNIWCKATILKIYCINKKVSSILVHYQQWAKIYDEVIEIKSTRLAPRQFFSSRNDIPRYNLGNEEQNLRGAVITGNNNEGSFRNNDNNVFTFSNILQLNNLRSRISSLQNNVVNELIGLPMSQRNRQVGFLHHVIESDSEESNNYRSRRYRNFNNFEFERDDENDSSLGQFLFGHEAIQLDESQGQSHEGRSQIGQPAGNQEYISIHDSQEIDNEDEIEESEGYWNARPTIELQEMQDEQYQEQGSADEVEMQFLSPFYGRAVANTQIHVDADEYSYGENSYSLQ